MATSDLALGANIDNMIIATPGKDAPDPTKIPPKRALFSSPTVVAHNKNNESTPSTTERCNIRESHIVIWIGGSITNTPEQFIANVIKAIDAEKSLEQLLKNRPLEMTAQALVKITSEPLDGIKCKDLVFLNGRSSEHAGDAGYAQVGLHRSAGYRDRWILRRLPTHPSSDAGTWLDSGQRVDEADGGAL